MNDQEIADALVRFGIGHKCPDRGYQFKTDQYDMSGVAEQFVRDGRVMLAAIGKIPCGLQLRIWNHASAGWARVEIWTNKNAPPDKQELVVGRDNELSRAVCEAVARALENEE